MFKVKRYQKTVHGMLIIIDDIIDMYRNVC